MTTTILFVRHGETEWNLEKRFRGRFDVPLDPTGVEQASKTARYIQANWEPDFVYSSPLSRTLATAQAIADLCGLKPVAEPGLIDTNYGEWQGLTHEEVKQRWPELFAQWQQSPHTVRLPGGETLAEVRKRAMAAVAQLVAQHASTVIVIVSHDDVLRLVLMEILGIRLDRFESLHQDNCAVSLVERTAEKYVVCTMNCTAHLDHHSDR